tara:strand:- start:716 stop:1444 length:729 start_codon:yes stop_codon:yes gene_type:complete
MKIAIVTSSPDLVSAYIDNTILKQAVLNKSVSFFNFDIREHSNGQYRQIDDTPFGGGSGMVLMPAPLIKAIDNAFIALDANVDNTRVIYPSPQGKLWTQDHALENVKIENIIFICGRYKGIDQRVIDEYVTHEYSLGDFIISNGELGSMVMIDSILRFLPGTMNNIESALSDSFSSNLLDHPHYTKPRVIKGLSVPEVLLGGHHKKIKSWRRNKSEDATKSKRPDLWEKYNKSIKQLEINHE